MECPHRIRISIYEEIKSDLTTHGDLNDLLSKQKPPTTTWGKNWNMSKLVMSSIWVSKPWFSGITNPLLTLVCWYLGPMTSCRKHVSNIKIGQFLWEQWANENIFSNLKKMWKMWKNEFQTFFSNSHCDQSIRATKDLKTALESWLHKLLF